MDKTWRSSLEQDLKAYKALVAERDKKVGAFLEFDPERSVKGVKVAVADGPLAGIPVAVKDNISVDNFHCTCGSRMLKDFVAPYDATVVKKLKDQGAVVVGKTNLDEFGMGSSTENSALGKTHNPHDLGRVAGGSSGGSAAAVAAGLVPLALGTDTGGSVRQPASFCGVYGFKPTYGVASRYGLVAYASSLETVGIMSDDLSMVHEAYTAIRGLDPQDHTTVDYSKVKIDPKGVATVGVLRNRDGLDASVRQVYDEQIAYVRSLGMGVVEFDLPTLEYAVPAYYTIASAEASANLARYNGIRYGHRPVFSENPEDLVRQARDQGFGPEVKLRILLGTYVLRSGFQDQYYGRAQKVRTAIRNDFDRLFAQVDAILMPVFPTAAFAHGDDSMDAFQQKLADKFTTLANLTGMPGLALPGRMVGGLPVGLQVLAPAYHEHRLFDLAGRLAAEFPVVRPEAFPAVYQ